MCDPGTLLFSSATSWATEWMPDSTQYTSGRVLVSGQNAFKHSPGDDLHECLKAFLCRPCFHTCTFL